MNLATLPPGSVVSTPFPDHAGNIAEKTSDGYWMMTGETALLTDAELEGMADSPFTVLRTGYSHEQSTKRETRMSERYEMYDAKGTAISARYPNAAVGDDRLGDGVYAFVLAGDQATCIQGKPNELKKFLVTLDECLQVIETHAATPPTSRSFYVDDHHDVSCPACTWYTIAKPHDSIGDLMDRADAHLAEAHPKTAVTNV